MYVGMNVHMHVYAAIYVHMYVHVNHVYIMCLFVCLILQLVLHSQTAIFLLYWVGENRVWYIDDTFPFRLTPSLGWVMIGNNNDFLNVLTS